MSKTLRKKGILKTLGIGVLGFMASLTLVSGVNKLDVSAHNSYFMSITVDNGNGTFRYIPNIIKEDNSFRANGHAEAQLGRFSKDNKSETSNVPIISSYDGSTKEKMEEAYKDVVKKDGDGDKSMIYTFPPEHWRIGGIDANGLDADKINKVADIVVDGLNQALSFMVQTSGGKYDMNRMKQVSAELANKANSRSGSVTLGNVTYSLSSPNKEFALLNGTDKSDYVQINANGKGSIIVPFRLPKGYVEISGRKGDYLVRPELKSENGKYYKELVEEGDVQYLDWKAIVLQGNYNADVKGITFSNEAEISKPSEITVQIGDFLNNCVSSLRRLLGLYPMEDLILNNGTRGANYYYGVMPKAWMSSATLLYAICQIIAWNLIGFSFVRLIFKRQLNTMNIGEKISVQEGFKNLFLTAFLLVAFSLIFYGMLRVNSSLVNVFGKSSQFSSYIESTESINSGMVGTILISIAFLVLNIYFNFFYVLRAVTIALLFAIAPLCIYTLSLGGKYLQIFATYMKELVSNIFIQSFHALLVAFFTSITSATKLRTFEVLVVFASFIPLTNFIKQLFGMGGGITDTADKLTGIGSAVIGGAVGGVIGAGGAIGSKVGSHSSSQGGGVGRVTNSPINPNATSSLEALQNKSVEGTGELQIGNNKRDAIKAGAKVGGQTIANTMRGVGSLGMALGHASTGDVKGAINSVKGLSKVSGGGGRGYSSSSGANPVLTKNQAVNELGIDSLYDNGESISANYNTSLDDKGELRFDNENIDTSKYGNNIREMYNAFNSKGDYATGGSKESIRNNVIENYRQMGIEDVKLSDNRLNVEFDKNLMSRHRDTYSALRSVGELQPNANKPKVSNPIRRGI